jgi:TusA-related sulfurtransferase
MDIDARGLSCPQPIIETRKAIFDKVTSFSVLVDNIAAKENVTRFAKTQHYDVVDTTTEYGWKLDLEKR